MYCCALSHYVRLVYGTLCVSMILHVMLFYAMVLYPLLAYLRMCYSMPYCAKLQFATLRYDMLCSWSVTPEQSSTKDGKFPQRHLACCEGMKTIGFELDGVHGVQYDDIPFKHGRSVRYAEAIHNQRWQVPKETSLLW